LVGSEGPRGSSSRDLPRVARRAGRRLRRALGWRNLAAALLIAVCFAVIMAALSGPPPRATAFRTDPVLRAMGVPQDEPAGEYAALAAVPSLSASPRFVLPVVRDAGKRRLAALPPAPSSPPAPAMAPPVDVAAIEPAAAPPPVKPPGAPEAVVDAPARAVPAPVPVPAPVLAARPAPRLALKPRPEPPALTTALAITPVLPPEPQHRPQGGPELAIVIDDLGPAPALSRRAIGLPVPVTLAFLPYADDLPALTAAARDRGHEIYLHLPMEPLGSPDPGPNAILVGLAPDELDRRLQWAFDRLPLATGVNNHMGSRATSDPETMLKVLQEVRRRGLDFVDSRTSPMSVGDGLAAQLGIPHAGRDVFLDNNPASGAILLQLGLAERQARRQGHALAIGHPYPTTLAVLESWLPEAQARGLRIVSAGELIDRLTCEEEAPIQVNACIGPDCPPPPGC
jgi:hypothetical protein